MALGILKNHRKSLEIQLKETNAQLGKLNRELADKMVLLASQTGDTEPLIDAVAALRKAKTYYNAETAPQETIDIQETLADTLLFLSQQSYDKPSLESAVDAYRSAITLASLLGDEDRRQTLKSNYKQACALLGCYEKTPSLFKVA